MSHSDDDVRRVLHDAVSDVHPHGTLDDIRSRTDQVVPMKRWFLPTLAVAAVMALVVGGAFWLVHDSDDPAAGPSGTPTQGSSPTGTPSQSSDTGTTSTRAVPIYYVGDTAHGEKLYREFHQAELCAGTECLLKASAVAAVNGTPQDSDYRTLWPDGATVGAVSQDGDTIVIDLATGVRDRPTGMSPEDAGLAVQQLVYSAQAAVGQGRLPVQLLIAGHHTDQVLGVPAAEPLAADNPDDVLAPVQVDSPADGASVAGTFTVTGRAATFEANVVWELKQGGAVVKKGFTTAEECCTLSPFSFDVTAPSGEYTLVVHDTDESGQDLPVDEDTKEITVR
jgi:hypothetical protein